MKQALGRGLDALITGGVVRSVAAESPHVAAPVPPAAGTSRAQRDAEGQGGKPEQIPTPAPPRGDEVLKLDINLIERSPLQPRTEFDPEHLKELADSIKQRGVIQPLLVRARRAADGTVKYELIAGERRWRASKDAGLTTLPAIVRQATDEEVLEMALIENLQREDLNPIEEARAYEQLAARFKLTQEQIALKVGKNRATVANAMRLLALPDEVQSWLVNGQLSVGHAKAILGLTIAEEQRLVAERVLRRGLTVRDTEQLVEQLKGEAKSRAGSGAVAVKSPHVAVIEERLRQKLGTAVSVRHGKKKGRIEIEYYGNDELARLLGLFGIDDL